MGKLHQYLTGIAASFATLLMGSLNAWPSYTLALYTSENSTILSTPMSELEVSLVGSLPSLGAMVGVPITGIVLDAMGRKRGCMSLIIPYILCWTVIELSSSATPILLARFIGGIGGGAGLVYAPIFISEIAEPSIRGTLAAGTVIMYGVGVLVSYLNGWFLSYSTIIWVNLVLCVVNILLLSMVVESPVFLLKRRREREALQALAQYRTGSISSKSVLEELSLMKLQISPAVELEALRTDAVIKEDEAEKEKLNTDEIVVEPPKQSSFKSLFTVPASRRAFLVVGTAFTLQVLMGMLAVQVYAGELFSKAAPNLSSDLCSVLLALVLLAGGIVTGVIADKAGRRVLLITSSVFVGLCMGSLGYLLTSEAAPAWVSAVIILVYCFCFNFGAGAVPYVLLAEVFPSEVQSIASMILIEWIWFLNFILIAVFPFMVSSLGVHGSFYLFACIGLANAVLSYLNIPETKGLSTKQIQELFTK